MVNYIKESFSITNKYIILATPLILFSLISSVYIVVAASGSKFFGVLFALLLVILMLAAFLAGWFYMVKGAVRDEESDDPNMLIKAFPSGVGEYFLPAIGMIFNVLVLSSILVLGSYFAGMKLIGDIGISAEAISKSMESVTAMKAFLLSLTDSQLLKLNAWNLLLFSTMCLTYFLVMFYAPAMFLKDKNPFKSFALAMKDLFSRKFFNNLLLFTALFLTYFVLSILTTILGMNVVMHFVFTLLNFYYLVFAAILIFNYYYLNFVKIGGILDKQV